MAEGALSHLRVIDLTHYIAGPHCTKLMAGFGAEVIKIERPGTGDKMRGMGPFFRNEPGLERSIPFLWLNTGKKSVTLNLKSEKGKEILKQLVQDADVLIENFSPRVMPGLGLSYDTLQEINPRLVMTSISNFGQTGPYRDYRAEEIVEYAMSGGMYMTGDPSKAPLKSGPAVCQYTAGIHAYIATLIAVFQQGITGKGQYIDVSIQESALENVEINLVNYLQLGKLKRRSNDRHQMVPWELYGCADGEIALIGGPIRHWLKFAEIFEEPRLLDPKYRHVLGRIRHREEFEALLEPCVKKFNKKELFNAGISRKLAFGYLADFDDVLDSPQHQSRDFFVEIDHPNLGKHKYCSAPFNLSETPWQPMRSPVLGEHNETLYAKMLGYSPKEIQHLRKQGII